MIGAVFKKDWVLLWPLVVLVTLLQVALECAVFKYGFFGASPLAREILRLLTPAWYIGIVALAVVVVHEDTVPGVDQDWLIRPLERTDLLLAKLLFVAITVCVPMLVVNVVNELALGFAFVPSVGDAIYKEVYVFVCLLVPAMALAAATRNAVELLVIVAGLVVLYVVSVWVGATVSGVEQCPTCGTSVAWIQSLLQHLGVLVGAAVVLAVQYYQRKTQLARLLLATGVVLVVVIQVPWNLAFAIQSGLAAPVGTAASALAITAGATTVESANDAGPSRQDSAKRAAQALLQGDLDAAVQIKKSSGRPAAAPLILTVPLSIEGATPNEFLVVDRAELTVLDANGRTLYRASRVERGSSPLIADASGLIAQTFEVPAVEYQKLRPRAVSLVIDYWLTVRAMVARYQMPATGGELRAAEIGVCRSNADSGAAYFRCRRIGRAPNCMAATLHGPQGQHNPPVLTCGSDYRPFIPSPLNIISFAAMDLPIRDSYGVAHYAVDGSQIRDTSIEVKVYEPGAHFQRRVTSRLQTE